MQCRKKEKVGFRRCKKCLLDVANRSFCSMFHPEQTLVLHSVVEKKEEKNREILKLIIKVQKDW